jgi:DNA-directed RNA polymerase subunit M/transcription elongation factor TFIIS
MKAVRICSIILLMLTAVLVWAFAQTTQQEAPKTPQQVVPKKFEQTAFEKRCSICHTLQDVRTGMEKIIKQMHEKAGIEISERSLMEIEATFTLLPLEEPHKGMFQEKCGKCHSLDVVVKAHQTKDEAEMKTIIERMAEKKGSGIKKEEIEKIHDSMLMLNEIYEPDVELKKEEEKKEEK